MVHIRNTKLLVQCYLSPEEFGLCCHVDYFTLCILRKPTRGVRHFTSPSADLWTHGSLSSGGDRLILSLLFLLHRLLNATLRNGLSAQHITDLCTIVIATIQCRQKLVGYSHVLYSSTLDLLWNTLIYILTSDEWHRHIIPKFYTK